MGGVSPSKTRRDQSAGTRSKDGPTPKKQRIKSKTSPETLTPQTKTTSDAHTRKLQQHQNVMSADSQPKKHVRSSQNKVPTEDEIGQALDDILIADGSEILTENGAMQVSVGTDK